MTEASRVDTAMKGLDEALPDPALRDRALGLVAESLRIANDANPAVWGLGHPGNAFVRLNVGRIFVIDIRQDRIVLALDERDARATIPELLASALHAKDASRAVPGVNWYGWPHKVVIDNWEQLRPIHEPAVAACARQVKRTPYFRAHSPELVDELARTVGQTLPQPVYEEGLTDAVVEEMVSLLRQRYPDWDGFSHDAFRADEIEYKRQASEKFHSLLARDELERLIDRRDTDGLTSRLKTIASSTNLLFRSVPAQGDLAVLERVDNLEALARSLRDLLYGDGSGPERLAAWARWVDERGVPNKWTFPTYLLFLSDPEQHVFVKPTVTTEFMKLAGRPESFTGGPSADKYELLLDLAAELTERLARFGARDMIDVQSFMYVVAKQAESKKKTPVGGEQSATDVAGALRTMYDKYRETYETDAAYTKWHADVVGFIEWIRKTPVAERTTEAFQRRLWNENPVSAAGQGDIKMDAALSDPSFRQRIAEISTEKLSPERAAREARLAELMDELVDRLQPVCRKLPWLKIKRVLAALFPRDMTCMASGEKMRELTRVVFGQTLKRTAAHSRLIRSLDQVLGEPGESLDAQVERLNFPWFLHSNLDELRDQLSGTREADDGEAPDVDDEDDAEEPGDLADPSPRTWQGEVPAFSEIHGRISGHFDDAMVQVLHAGLWAHPRRHFAVLTGLSGAGKTLLARGYPMAFAEAASYPNSADEYVHIVAVQPGWTDPGAFLGYPNPLRPGTYVRTPALEFLLRAVRDPGHAYALVLDEMNLSHPEQYLAPLLSAMETGAPIELHGEAAPCEGLPGRIAYPANLVIIGTVNMDETTHGLSDKILDRALTLEFWDIDLADYPRAGKREALAPDAEAAAMAVLGDLMDSLAPARLHFGWRVVDEVLDFVVKATGDSVSLPLRDALDRIVYAKVLPKLRGEDAPRIRTALESCEDALRRHRLERSAAKVAELRLDLDATGSMRFWR